MLSLIYEYSDDDGGGGGDGDEKEEEARIFNWIFDYASLEEVEIDDFSEKHIHAGGFLWIQEHHSAWSPDQKWKTFFFTASDIDSTNFGV